MRKTLRHQVRELLNPDEKEKMLIYYVNPITGKTKLLNPKKRKHETETKKRNY